MIWNTAPEMMRGGERCKTNVLLEWNAGYFSSFFFYQSMYDKNKMKITRRNQPCTMSWIQTTHALIFSSFFHVIALNYIKQKARPCLTLMEWIHSSSSKNTVDFSFFVVFLHKNWILWFCFHFIYYFTIKNTLQLNIFSHLNYY